MDLDNFLTYISSYLINAQKELIDLKKIKNRAHQKNKIEKMLKIKAHQTFKTTA